MRETEGVRKSSSPILPNIVIISKNHCNLEFQEYKDLVDFDNHLDDLTQDYLNVQMNMVIDQAL